MDFILQNLGISNKKDSIVNELGEEFLEYLNLSGWTTYEDINGNLICIINIENCPSGNPEILSKLIVNKNNLFFLDIKNVYTDDKIYLPKIKNYFGKCFGTIGESKKNLIIFKLNCDRIDMLNSLFSSGFYHTSYATLEFDEN